MNKLKLSLLAAGTLAMSMAPVASYATQIAGSISFYGNVTPYVGNPNTPGTMAPDYPSAHSLVFGFTQVAAGANGSFAGIAAGTAVTVNGPLGVNPPTILPAGTPLWLVGGFTFTLTSLTEPVLMPNVLVLEGTGTMSDGNPADTTLGTWVATFTSASSSSGVTFSWNSSSASSPNAPESGTNLVIMGLGLAGLATFAKFRKQDAIASV